MKTEELFNKKPLAENWDNNVTDLGYIAALQEYCYLLENHLKSLSNTETQSKVEAEELIKELLSQQRQHCYAAYVGGLSKMNIESPDSKDDILNAIVPDYDWLLNEFANIHKSKEITEMRIGGYTISEYNNTVDERNLIWIETQQGEGTTVDLYELFKWAM